MPVGTGLMLFITIGRWFRLGWRRSLPTHFGLADVAVASLLSRAAPAHNGSVEPRHIFHAAHGDRRRLVGANRFGAHFGPEPMSRPIH
jgi:hypothetical protein